MTHKKEKQGWKGRTEYEREDKCEAVQEVK